jgi:hypothetical protein
MGEDNKEKFSSEMQEYVKTEQVLTELEERNRESRVKREYERNRQYEESVGKLDELDPLKLFKNSYDPKVDTELDGYEREDAKLNRPFVDKEFQKHCKVARHQLYGFCAAQKQGKTTFAANIAYSMHEIDCKVLFISNEELKKDVLGRIAAIKLGLNYNNHVLGNNTEEEAAAIQEHRASIAKTVTVISEEDADTKDADVLQKIIEAVPGQGYDMVIIDYISKVCKSSKMQVQKDWEAQEPLWYFMDKAKKMHGMPCIVVFSQCAPQGPKDKRPLKERLEGRKLLPNFCTGVYEIIKDKRAGATLIDIAMSRWYSGVDEHVFRFDKGRLISMDFDEYIERLAEDE